MQVPYVDLVGQHSPLRAEILEAIGRVLDHGQFILGPEVQELECRLAGQLGVRDIVGVNSGTDALVLALRLHGIQPGDEVITVSHSFVATATAVVLCGAQPVFVDIDEETMLLDPGRLEEAITSKTKAVIPVHLNGHPCEMEAIASICQKHELLLLEDAAQAFGTLYREKSVGSFGVGAFSLHPLKILSACGDAGFLAVGSEEEGHKLRQLRNIGLKNRDQCVEVSGNSRLDTLQAAILLVKLKHLDNFIHARQEHANAYRQAFAGRVRLPPEQGPHRAIYSAFVVRHPKRDQLQSALLKRGVDAKIHYPLGIHQQEAFREFHKNPLPVTEKVVSEILSLPVTPELSEEKRAFVIKAMHEALDEVSGNE